MQDFTPLDRRGEKFKIKETSLTKDKDQLNKYREDWSKGNHNFNRTYLGSAPFKKAMHD